MFKCKRHAERTLKIRYQCDFLLVVTALFILVCIEIDSRVTQKCGGCLNAHSQRLEQRVATGKSNFTDLTPVQIRCLSLSRVKKFHAHGQMIAIECVGCECVIKFTPHSHRTRKKKRPTLLNGFNAVIMKRLAN